jgi:hypothetical protein
MGISSDALYLNLLSDLQTEVPGFSIQEPWPGITARQYAATRIAASLLKKLVEEKSSEADAVALSKFEDSNRLCGEWVEVLENTKDEILVGEFKRSLYDFFYPKGEPLITSAGQILDRLEVGPGASLKARGTDLYTKLFDSPLSSYSGNAFKAYQHWMQENQTWYSAEDCRQDNGLRYSVDVEGNSINFADKTNECSRVICTEASVDMIFQLGIGLIIEDRLYEYFGIKLDTQPVFNGELARRYARRNDGFTIDLSEASNSIGLSMCKTYFPANPLAFLCMFRAPKSNIMEGNKKRAIELNMLSSMGNGYTFPVETLIFASIVEASARVEGIKLYKSEQPAPKLQFDSRPDVLRAHVKGFPGNWGVFGDDIVAPSSILHSVSRLLKILGFRLNMSKSFVEGPFRESCGSDWFHTSEVRGVYIKSLLTPQQRYAAINELTDWSCKTGIILRKTISCLVETVKFLPVPAMENPDAGIRLPWSLVPLRMRQYDTNLRYSHEFPYLYGHAIYKAMVVRPFLIRIHEDLSMTVPESEKPRSCNPPGLHLAFLYGCVKDCTIALRHERPWYDARWRATHSWDRFVIPELTNSGVTFGTWESAASRIFS